MFVAGEKVEEFVTEDGYAAWLEADDRYSCFDFGREFVKNTEQQRFRAAQHSVVVEWTSAAKERFGNGNSEAERFQDFNGSFGGIRVEIIVEGVGPEEDGFSAGG